jgi:Lon protease-like protein
MNPRRHACALCIVALMLMPGVVSAQRGAPEALPRTIPIFPLPDAVLFPNVSLGVYVFEPRYRAMLRDALRGDGIIGMVQLQPGYESGYTGRPPINPIGCAGAILEAEPMTDGRIKVVLRGLVKFRVTGEDDSRPYRLAQVEELPEFVNQDERTALRKQRERLDAMLTPPGGPSALGRRFPRDIADEDLINALSQYLNVGPLERQALLEQPGVLARAEALIATMEKLNETR